MKKLLHRLGQGSIVALSWFWAAFLEVLRTMVQPEDDGNAANVEKRGSISVLRVLESNAATELSRKLPTSLMV